MPSEQAIERVDTCNERCGCGTDRSLQRPHVSMEACHASWTGGAGPDAWAFLDLISARRARAPRRVKCALMSSMSIDREDSKSCSAFWTCPSL